MKLEHSFTVPVGVEQAWDVLLDIERVAPCMPGAALDSVDGDNFTGRVKIKLGPVNLTYKGAASFVEKDEAARRVVLDANGKDARGNGTAAAKVTATLVGQGESTQVNVLTDLNITGKPAQFGRGVMVDVGNKLIGQFASCLEDKIGGGSGPADPAAQASSAATSEQEAPAQNSAASAAAAGPDARDAAKDEPSSTTRGEGSGSAAAAPAPTQEPPAASSGASSPGVTSTSTPTAKHASTGTSTASATPAPTPAPAAPAPAATPRKPAADPEPIDLLELAGGSVLTRVAPVAGGAAVLLLLFFFLRRRR